MSTERVSVGSSSEQGDGPSYVQSTGQLVSADGRFVVFNSIATNLAPNDTASRDVFVRDRVARTTELVSVKLAGGSAGYSGQQAISANGKTVAFGSLSSKLVATPVPAWVSQIYVRDLVSGRTEVVSVDSDGAPGNADSENPNLSADGRFVVFSSFATNIAPGSRSGVRQVYLHDRSTGVTERVSVDGQGLAGNGNSDRPVVSDDGQVVAFDSRATNFLLSDRNGAYEDVFVRDRRTGTTELASVSPKGNQSGYSWIASLSADGLSVAYESNASDSCNTAMCVFVRNRSTATTALASVNSAGEPAAGSSGGARLSADARFVAFYSDAANLDAGDDNGDIDVFVRDLRGGTTRLASRADSGAQGDARSYNPSLSADGRTVAFESWATTLASDDTNAAADVFIRVADPDAAACDPAQSWLSECSLALRVGPAPDSGGTDGATDPRETLVSVGSSYLSSYADQLISVGSIYYPQAAEVHRLITGRLMCSLPDPQSPGSEPLRQVPISFPGYGSGVTDDDGYFVVLVGIAPPQNVRLEVSYEGKVWGGRRTAAASEVSTRLQIMDDIHHTRTDALDRSGELGTLSLDLDSVELTGVDCELWVLGAESLQDYHDARQESPPAGELRIKRWGGVLETAVAQPHTLYDYVVITTDFQAKHPHRSERRSTIAHEFGHAIRHVLSAGGDPAKWFDDAFRFTYGRHVRLGHEVDNMGNAFNEGWAEYWAEYGYLFLELLDDPIAALYDIKGLDDPDRGFWDWNEYPLADWNEHLVIRRLSELTAIAIRHFQRPGEAWVDAGRRVMVQVLEDNPGAIYTLYDFEVKFFELVGQANDRTAPGSCPPGFEDDLVTCSNRSTNTVIVKTSYSRGVGVPIASCPEGKEEDAGLCYEPCRAGYYGWATGCYEECPIGYADYWLTCGKDGRLYSRDIYDRGVGSELTCAPGLVYDWGLCYTPCLPHYTGRGPGCWY